MAKKFVWGLDLPAAQAKQIVQHIQNYMYTDPDGEENVWSTESELNGADLVEEIDRLLNAYGLRPRDGAPRRRP